MQTPSTIKKILDTSLEEYCFSGYQIFAKKKEQTIESFGGRTNYFGMEKKVTPFTYFDLGSLTKVILTTSCLARAFDRKEIFLTDPIKKYDPSLPAQLGDLKLENLLSHSTGLSAWRPIYLNIVKQDLESWFRKHSSNIWEEKNKPIYSDLNFLLLGFVLKKIWGGIEIAFQKEVVDPLKLKDIGFNPKGVDCAATEYCSVRQKILVGEVFDENTWSLGGVSSHAGLFGTVSSLVPWCESWLQSKLVGTTWLSKETAQLFTKRSLLLPESTWAYGWDTKSKAFSSLGDRFSEKSFGHLGFPGTSVWIDPQNEAFVILLTNRIHPSRVDERIKKIRPLLHQEIAVQLGV